MVYHSVYQWFYSHLGRNQNLNETQIAHFLASQAEFVGTAFLIS